MDVDCKLETDRFVTQKREMAAQYADLYFVRLLKLKSDLIQRSKAKWDTPSNQPKVCQRILDAEIGVRCIMVGTLYKEMKLKPNILDELNGEGPIATESMFLTCCDLIEQTQAF
jgi:DNA polymerase delta subunit 2